MKSATSFLITILSLLPVFIYANNEANIAGARASGLAGNSISFVDFWSTENNPAGLGFLKEWGAGFFYSNPFSQKELAFKSAVFAYPLKKSSLGLSLNQFGFSDFNETKIGISYGKQLGEQLALGIQINRLSTHIGEGYGTRSTITGNVGIIAHINDKITTAAVIINPSRSKRADFDNERYPSILKLGIRYSYSEKVSAFAEIVKDVDFDPDIRIGIEYHIVKHFDLRVGYATDPARSSFGFGIDLKQFRLDFASSFDSNLGFTPRLSLSFSPKPKKKE